MSKHTPGPWTVRTDDPNYGKQIFIRGRNTLIAEMNHVNRNSTIAPEDVEADARLVAAAPEMLEALKAIRDKGYGSAFGARATANAVLKMVMLAEDAILKAEPNSSEGERRQLTIDGDPSEEPQHKKGKS